MIPLYHMKLSHDFAHFERKDVFETENVLILLDVFCLSSQVLSSWSDIGMKLLKKLPVS